MTKVKVLDLAREVGMEDDKLLLKLKRMGVKVKDKKPVEPEKIASPLDEKIIERDSEKEIIEKRVKPTVIRRRTRSLEMKVEPPPPPPPPITMREPVMVEEKPSRAGEEKAARAVRVLKEAVEKKELKKDEKTQEPVAMPIGAKAEVKETIPTTSVEEVAPLPVTLKEVGKRAEAKKEVEELKTKEIPIKKVEVKVPSKEEFLEKEDLSSLPGKKKGSVKKRRVIEERMLPEDEIEGEGRPEKGLETRFRPFRPMKKKVVLKTPKKTDRKSTRLNSSH